MINKKGYIPVQVLGIAALMGVMTTLGTVDSAMSGNLKKGAQTVWCKMQNKGADYCDAKYGFVADVASNPAK